MDNDKTGGPAFPLTPENYSFNNGQPGMTLRDAFAIAALPAIINYLNKVSDELIESGQDPIDDFYKLASTSSYAMADAMLEARKK